MNQYTKKQKNKFKKFMCSWKDTVKKNNILNNKYFNWLIK